MRYYKSCTEPPREIASNEVFTGLQAVISLQEYIMAAIDDLTKAVNDAVAKIAGLEAQLASAPVASSVSDTAAEALASQLEAAVNPAPAAPATPAAS